MNPPAVSPELGGAVSITPWASPARPTRAPRRHSHGRRVPFPTASRSRRRRRSVRGQWPWRHVTANISPPSTGPWSPPSSPMTARDHGGRSASRGLPLGDDVLRRTTSSGGTGAQTAERLPRPDLLEHYIECPPADLHEVLPNRGQRRTEIGRLGTIVEPDDAHLRWEASAPPRGGLAGARAPSRRCPRTPRSPRDRLQAAARARSPTSSPSRRRMPAAPVLRPPRASNATRRCAVAPPTSHPAPRCARRYGARGRADVGSRAVLRRTDRP